MVGGPCGAVDRARTGDLNLGKSALEESRQRFASVRDLRVRGLIEAQNTECPLKLHLPGFCHPTGFPRQQ